MDPAQVTIYYTGLALSIGGMVMWAWNEFGLWFFEEVAELGEALRASVRWVLVRLRIVKPGIVVNVEPFGLSLKGGQVTVKVGEGAELEDKVEYLMRARELHESRFLEIDERIDEVRDELRAEIQFEHRRLSAEKIGIRRLGVGLAIIGLLLLTIAPHA
jgi:hypothetical protein